MSIPRLLAALAVTVAVAPAVADDHDVAEAVAEAHGRDRVPANAVLRGQLTVDFGGRRTIDAADLWFHSNGALVRLESGGEVAVFDGSTAWATPEFPIGQPRFQLLTWPYFAVMPFKLDDGGANLEPLEPAPLREGEEPSERARLTFDAGVGDSPDDWYVLYLNAQNQLVASGYIVTYGQSAEQAEAAPHAIVYRDFADVPGVDGEATGVVLSTSWDFYNWTADGGIVGEPIGRVTLENLAFAEPPEGAFEPPEGSQEVAPPLAE